MSKNKRKHLCKFLKDEKGMMTRKKILAFTFATSAAISYFTHCAPINAQMLPPVLIHQSGAPAWGHLDHISGASNVKLVVDTAQLRAVGINCVRLFPVVCGPHCSTY